MLGEDVSEVLEYVPSYFKVVRHVRPRMSCRWPFAGRSA
jgi:transposase